MTTKKSVTAATLVKSKLTGGWSIALGAGILIAAAGTRFGKLAAGFTSVALIYQLSSLVSGAAKDAKNNPIIPAELIPSINIGSSQDTQTGSGQAARSLANLA